MFTRLLKAFFAQCYSGSRITASRLRGVTAASEALEGRRLLSFSFSGGVLTFDGTGNADTITAYRINNMSGDNVFVRREATPTPEIAGPYSASSVTKVVINGASGTDTILAEVSGGLFFGNAAFNKPLEVFGDGDNDTITGGDGADTLHGGYGDDSINGGGGGDLLYGEYGSDNLSGGEGDDIGYGGYGDDSDTAADTLDGGNGDDQMNGEGGNDLLIGGGGADGLSGGEGDDNFSSADGFGNDVLSGGPGTDSRLDFDSGDTFLSIEI